MENVKQKKTFKQTVKDTGSKAKAYAKKQGTKVKIMAKSTPRISVTRMTLALRVVG